MWYCERQHTNMEPRFHLNLLWALKANSIALTCTLSPNACIILEELIQDYFVKFPLYMYYKNDVIKICMDTLLKNVLPRQQ